MVAGIDESISGHGSRSQLLSGCRANRKLSIMPNPS
jgi:hypothetical protein